MHLPSICSSIHSPIHPSIYPSIHPIYALYIVYLSILFIGPDELTDPPSRADWMNTVASDAPMKCDMLAIQLLKDEYERFKAETKDESPEGRYAALYNAWHRIEHDNFTREKIIGILKMKSIKEISLSEKLEKLYKN